MHRVEAGQDLVGEQGERDPLHSMLGLVRVVRRLCRVNTDASTAKRGTHPTTRTSQKALTGAGEVV